MKYTEWALDLSLQNDNHGALAKYQRAYCINPSNNIVYHYMRVMLCDFSRYQEGVVCFEKAYKFRDGLLGSHSQNNSGYALRCVERYDEAIEKFGRAIVCQGRYDLAYINLGMKP